MRMRRGEHVFVFQVTVNQNIGDTDGSGYVSSATGFSYTQADGISPTLYYSQELDSSETAGEYTITLTFTGSTS